MKKFIFANTIMILFLSCRENSTSEIFSNIQNYSTYIKSNFSLYHKVYNQLNDTLNEWKNDTLAISKPYFFDDNSRLDSLMVFNLDSTRCYANLVRQKKSVPSEDIQGIGGAKIKGKWYFFFCTSTVVDRAAYQDSIYATLSFDELSYLAREHLQKAYTIHENDSITANDSFFGFMYNRNDWGLPKNSSLEELDSLIVARNAKKHQHKIDPKELEDIKKDMARSVRPPEPKQDISLWQKLFGKEEKLFESKEWKEYLRNKYGKDVN